MKAARRFGVPFSTLYDHTKVSSGSPTILTVMEEKELVATLQVLQEIGFGVMKELVGVVIHQPFCPNPFRDSPSDSGEKSGQTDSGDTRTDVVLKLSGKYTINNTVTPIKFHLTGYFTEVLCKNYVLGTKEAVKWISAKIDPKSMERHLH